MSNVEGVQGRELLKGVVVKMIVVRCEMSLSTRRCTRGPEGTERACNLE